MPYISREDREALIAGGEITHPGQLNFLLSSAVDNWFEEQGGLTYQRANEVLGVLALLEMEQVLAGVVPMHLSGRLSVHPVANIWHDAVERAKTSVRDTVGVLRAVSYELYRRFLSAYEDDKLADNGEVFKHLAEGKHTAEEFRRLTEGL